MAGTPFFHRNLLRLHYVPIHPARYILPRTVLPAEWSFLLTMYRFPFLSKADQHKSVQFPFRLRLAKQFVPCPGLLSHNPGLIHRTMQNKTWNPDSVFPSGSVRQKNGVDHTIAYSPVYLHRRKLHRKCAWTDLLIAEDLPVPLQPAEFPGYPIRIS